MDINNAQPMPTFCYPGTFSPPTMGHVRIVERAAKIFPHITVLCSVNDEKNDRWFSEQEVKKLWMGHRLPKNVSLKTLSEFLESYEKPIIMIRGIRDEADGEYERQVMKLNCERYGIDSFFYLMAEPAYAAISSTAVRKSAKNFDFEELARSVAPHVTSALLERAHGFKKIFLVVGKPGAGKSTFLSMLAKMAPTSVVIKTDAWNERFKPVIAAHFAVDEYDLPKLVLAHDEEVSRMLKKPWLAILKEELSSAPSGSIVFVEAAYGLPKKLFRYLGGNILYVGCENEDENIRRMNERKTPHLIAFLVKIPGKIESEKIAKEHGLSMTALDTNCSLEMLSARAHAFNETLKSGDVI